MPAEPPIACSLKAMELPKRLAEMAALGDAALLGIFQDSAHAELRFAARAGVRERVSAVVAAEADCCAFLAMQVGEDGDAVVLTVDAPDGAEPVLEQLVDAFRGRPPAAR